MTYVQSDPEYISPVQKVLELQAEVTLLRGYLRDAMAWIHPPEMVGDWDLWLAALGTDEGIPGSGQVGC